MSPAGRRPGSPETREAILAAAREEFTAAGYTAASVRQVARRAGVDPALVYHYFAGKPELFAACLRLPSDPRQVRAGARGGPPDGTRIVERFLAQWEDDPADPGRSFVTLTQAVSSSPEVARALREFLTERVWAYRRQGDTPPAPPAAPAAALVASQLLGTAWVRYVIRMEPFASASRSQVAAWVGPAVQAHINGAHVSGRPGSPEGARLVGPVTPGGQDGETDSPPG